MSAPKAPRKGSLQFWPRKRANKFLPSVNWDAIHSTKTLKGFICYKVGMGSALLKDNTPNSMTKGKKIAVPCTILECPSMKIFSVRFYKNGRIVKEILAENPDKELKKKIKFPKKKSGKIEDINSDGIDYISVIVYSQVKQTGLKKTPDLVEIEISGNLNEKINFIKENLNKELNISDFFEKGEVVDFRGITKGKGFQGPVKRFGISLKAHKSEKGVRRPGSLGPWHPARVTFRAPMAGQTGFNTRVVYNNKIIEVGKSEGKIKNIKNYGDIKTDYIIVHGSVQGPAKRQLVLTRALRPTKYQLKKSYEFLELK